MNILMHLQAASEHLDENPRIWVEAVARQVIVVVCLPFSSNQLAEAVRILSSPPLLPNYSN